MNCRGWNSHIALYVEGDLERDLSRDLESHLSACEECRAFTDELRESQAGIRHLRSEIIDGASLNRVRTKVLEQVRIFNERRTWFDRAGIFLWGGWRWRFAVLGSAALFAVSLLAWRFSLPEGTIAPPVQRVAGVPFVSPETPRATAIKRAVPVHQRLKPAELESAAANDQPKKPDAVIQLLTDDPNVVIYWLIEQTGGM